MIRYFSAINNLNLHVKDAIKWKFFRPFFEKVRRTKKRGQDRNFITLWVGDKKKRAGAQKIGFARIAYSNDSLNPEKSYFKKGPPHPSKRYLRAPTTSVTPHDLTLKLCPR